jgi:hypothetical protein
MYRIVPLLLVLLAAALHAETFPIVCAEDGFLLGAAGGGKWLPVEKAKETVKGGEQYRIYSLTERLGVAKGGKPHSADEPCLEQQIVPLIPKPAKGSIAVAAPWNPMPRTPRMQDTDQPVYQKAVADFLVSKKIHDPKVRITQIVRIDLDGDGEDEVLISATNYFNKDGRVPHGSPANSYSFVLLRRVVGGKVETVLIDGEFYPKEAEFNAPNAYRIAAVLDLDGDGKMEVVVESNYYEGGAMAAYRVTGKKPEQLVIAGCGA